MLKRVVLMYKISPPIHDGENVQGLVITYKINHCVPEKCREIIAARFPKIGNTIGNGIICAADFAL